MAETIDLGIVGIKNMGGYDSQTQYEKLNVVTYQGSTYCALKDTKGNVPTNTEYWQLYAQKGDKGDTGNTGNTGPQGPKGDTGSPGGKPLVASSTSEMTDTTSVYVNTTDGKWYFYDGDSWEIGGTYQSTELGEDTVDFLELKDEVNSQIKTKFLEENVDYTVTSGYVITNGLNINANSSYAYTSPIHLYKDDVIKLKAQGQAGVSIITLCSSTGLLLKYVPLSIDTTLKYYEYKATSDCYVALCSKAGFNELYVAHNLLSNDQFPIFNNQRLSSVDTIICDSNSEISYESNKYIHYSSGNAYTYQTADPPTYQISPYIEVLPNSYINIESDEKLSSSATDVIGICTYDKYYHFISGYQYASNKKINIQLTNDAKYIRYTLTRNMINYTFAIYYTSITDVIKSIASANPLEVNDLFKCFNKVGIIGDSLASGECAYKENGAVRYVDLFEYSWGQYMARDSGNTYYNFTRGGMTTRSWLTSNKGLPMATDGEHDVQCYIMALGVNDLTITDYLGTSSDIDLSDYNNNADTFYGNYAKIIQILTERNSKVKFFLMTIPTTWTTAADYNTAINYIANLFDNCYVLDLYQYTTIVNSGFILNNKRSGHYNALAYKYIAQLIEILMNKCIYDNYEDFEQIEFILTNYVWTD